MDEIDAEFVAVHCGDGLGVDEFTGLNTRRTGSLLARSCDSAILPRIRRCSVCSIRCSGHATSYQLHLTQVIEIGPGEPAQLIHRDQWAFDFFPFPAGFEVECHTMWAMNDFTAENGATRVIPGSHKFEDRRRDSPKPTLFRRK